jgi:hypothetical protein
MTRTLVLTTGDSGAGHQKVRRRGRGDKVLPLRPLLVREPAPQATDLADFFAQRAEIHRTRPEECGDWWGYYDEMTVFTEIASHLEVCERIEIWPDQSALGQLSLTQVLVWLGRAHPLAIAKLHVVAVEGCLGEMSPDDPRASNFAVVPIDARHLRAANSVWDAFTSPTPERWVALLQEDLTALPHFPALVPQMLSELPAEDTGLGASEARVLAAIEPGDVTPDEVWRRCVEEDPLASLGAFEAHKMIDLFSGGANKAIMGLEEGPYTEELVANEDRRRRYRKSRLSLTDVGRSLVERRRDFAKHGRINRWWGGTHITNDNCWRWNAAKAALIRPA